MYVCVCVFVYVLRAFASVMGEKVREGDYVQNVGPKSLCISCNKTWGKGKKYFSFRQTHIHTYAYTHTNACTHKYTCTNIHTHTFVAVYFLLYHIYKLYFKPKPIWKIIR